MTYDVMRGHMSSCGRKGASRAKERCLFAVRCNPYGMQDRAAQCTTQRLQQCIDATPRRCNECSLQSANNRGLQATKIAGCTRCNTCILDYEDLALIEGCTMQSLQGTRPATRRECKADILGDTRLETLQYILSNLKTKAK